MEEDRLPDQQSRWAAYFAEHMQQFASSLEYLADHWAYHRSLYDYIKSVVPKGGRILEVGCGPSASCAYLAATGYQVTGVDSDSGVLNMARRLLSSLGVSVRLEQANAFDLSRYYNGFDCVFSMGVLEHFDPAKTIELLREQGKVAPIVFFNIPSRHTQHTDERFYSPRQMAALVREAGLRPIRLFGYGRVMKTAWHRLFYHAAPSLLYTAAVDWLGHAMNQVCIARRP